MKKLKTLTIAALLSASFVSTLAMADVCPLAHRQHPGAPFVGVSIMVDGTTYCAYMPNRFPLWYQLGGRYKPDNQNHKWGFDPVSHVCGKVGEQGRRDGTRETCIFWPLPTK